VTQEKLGPRSSASEIVGSAVLVTLPSRAERRSGMQMAIKERQKIGPRFHVIEGVQDGSEGGRVGRLNFSFTTHFDTSFSVDAVHVEAVAVEEPDAREDGLEGCSFGDMLKMYFRKMDLEDKMYALNEAGGDESNRGLALHCWVCWICHSLLGHLCVVDKKTLTSSATRFQC
jgi:hypothetical protein